MAWADDPERGDRIRAAAGAVALQALLGYALIVGLGIHVPVATTDAIKLFDIAPAPPPPAKKPVVKRISIAKPKGAASPPNLRAVATPIVAPPPPLVPPPVPPPIVAAPVAGIGSAAFAGASDIPGPGSGSGGRGDGWGGGGSGDGDGAPPRLLRGRIRNSDYPDPYVHGSLETRYVVGTDGRVHRCIVTRSSGSALLDETTCRLVIKRYRYRPATDAAGRPVEVIVVQKHIWEVEDDPAPPQ